MHELSGFEQRLALALEVTAGAPRPVDAAAIARRAVGPRPVRRSGAEPRSLARLALVAAVIGAVIAGGVLVGAWLQQPTVPPSPPPSRPATSEPTTTADVMASTFSCAEAQAMAARTTTTWTAGPAPASPGASETGWIAVWGSDEIPELYLIHPETGVACRLARFDAYPNPPRVATPDGPNDWIPYRGPLVWSPDGKALAFVVVGQDNAVQDLYVWSEAGLAGPLLSLHDDSFLPGRPSWSPDGAFLAVPDLLNSHVPRATNIWILSRSGDPARAIASGCICHLGPVTWSASGQRIATTTRDIPGERTLVVGSVSGARLHEVPMSGLEQAADIEDAPYGFVDDETVFLVDPASSRFVARPINGGADRNLGDMGLSPALLDNHLIQAGETHLAPDRSAWLVRSRGLTVADRDRRTRTIVTGLPESFLAGWAPNSRAIGYVLFVQNEDQGIWVTNRDATGARQVAGGPFVLNWAPSAFAWQPVWPGQ